MEKFDPKEYWEKRLKQDYSLQGVGFINLGKSYNNWLYKVRKIVFHKLIMSLKIDTRQCNVLDIGSGTGFYIDRWAETGATNISGADITNVVIQNLSAKYPEHQFFNLDISDTDSLKTLPHANYDIISSFDVLFHIVDDAKFDQAISNISHILANGGLFIFSDNFIHQPTVRGVHQVSRSMDDIIKVLQANNLQVIKNVPMFILMNYPIDSTNRFLQLIWKGVAKIAALHDTLGFIIGALLFPIELLLLAVMKESPTTEIMICKKI